MVYYHKRWDGKATAFTMERLMSCIECSQMEGGHDADEGDVFQSVDAIQSHFILLFKEVGMDDAERHEFLGFVLALTYLRQIQRTL